MQRFRATICSLVSILVIGLNIGVSHADLIFADASERTFDGSGSFSAGYAPEYAQQSPFSLAATFTITSFPSDWVRIVGRGDSSNRNYGLWYSRPHGNFLFQAYGADGFNVVYDYSMQLDVEYSLVGVLDGNSARLYLNGSEVASVSSVGSSLYSELEPLTIGGADFHSIHQGTISDVGLWNHALTTEEVSTYAANGITQVAEPAVLALFGLGLMGIGYGRKRNRN